MFIPTDLAKQATPLDHSQTDGRVWALLHGESGALLVGCWYRPPHPGEVETIKRFNEEVQSHSTNAMGIIVVWDMNVHNASWLKYSSGTSYEGRRLQEVCSDNGLIQQVRSPMRNQYLLDLVLTDIASCKCEVLT